MNCANAQQFFYIKNKKKLDFISLFGKLWLFLPHKNNVELINKQNKNNKLKLSNNG